MKGKGERDTYVLLKAKIKTKSKKFNEASREESSSNLMSRFSFDGRKMSAHDLSPLGISPLRKDSTTSIKMSKLRSPSLKNMTKIIQIAKGITADKDIVEDERRIPEKSRDSSSSSNSNGKKDEEDDFKNHSKNNIQAPILLINELNDKKPQESYRSKGSSENSSAKKLDRRMTSFGHIELDASPQLRPFKKGGFKSEGIAMLKEIMKNDNSIDENIQIKKSENDIPITPSVWKRNNQIDATEFAKMYEEDENGIVKNNNLSDVRSFYHRSVKRNIMRKKQ